MTEPLRSTFTRNIAITIVGGVIVHRYGKLGASLPLTLLLMLWPSFGGHYVEVWFLRWLKPRLRVGRAAEFAVRVLVWFVGGMALGLGVALTANVLGGIPLSRWPAIWYAGLLFIGVELVAHLVLRLRGAPNVYEGAR